MDILQMRSKIAKVYDNFTWRNKVARMPREQVLAIYFSFQEQGKFDKKKQKDDYHQIDIFEYMKTMEEKK